MSDKRFLQILDQSLDRLMAGESVSSILESYPDQAERLQPLLETAEFPLELKQPAFDPLAKQRGREKVVASAETLLENNKSISPITLPGLSRLKERVIETLTGFTKEIMKMKLAYRIAIYAVISVMIGGFFTVSASASSVPGEPLYGVKRGWENARLALAVNEDSRLELEEKFEEQRVQEVKSLLAEGVPQLVEFTGEIQEKNDSAWIIGGFSVIVGPDTELKGTLELGTEAEVEAFTQEDGSLLAVEIESENENPEDDPESTDIPETTEPTDVPEPTDTNDDMDDDSDDDMDDDSDDDMDDDIQPEEMTGSGYLEVVGENSVTVKGTIYIFGGEYDREEEFAPGDYVEFDYYQNQAGDLVLIELEKEDPPVDTVTGTLEEIGDGYLIIDGATYYFGKDFDIDEDLAVGDWVEVEFYENMDGDLMLDDLDLDTNADLEDSSDDESDDDSHDDEDEYDDEYDDEDGEESEEELDD